MFKLTFNETEFTQRQLKEIEKSYTESLKTTENITPEFNVLSKSRTDLFGHVLSLFVRCDVHKVLQVTVSQLLDFLIDVASKYTEAPYHTFYHAADVTTMLYYFCHHLGAGRYLTDVDRTFLLIAAICHDMGHPGFSNSFQINTNTELATHYGHTSTLETYSVALSIELIKKHKLDLQHPTKITQIIEKLILSTDMIYHSQLSQQLAQLITSRLSTSKIVSGRKRKFDSVDPMFADVAILENKDDRISLCCILLHAADVSNMARPWIVSKQWSDQILQEFFSQGDEERKRNMAISPGMDRESSSQQSVSLKFEEFVSPYFQSLVALLPKSQILVDALKENRKRWETLGSVHCREKKVTRSSATTTTTTTTTTSTTMTKMTTTTTAAAAAAAATTTAIVTCKRIRLGYRSQSYPTVLYNNHFIIEKTNLLPLVNFKPSLLYDTTKNNVESIVLYHPYDM
ncbi:MAG: hypothetical protein EXX96DRAFT_554835 [Benjaminiella poitrasii]|nr:MAG: hypothetical protein EXX96DRAFT_554835 [Benjaminiella poitrasii]